MMFLFFRAILISWKAGVRTFKSILSKEERRRIAQVTAMSFKGEAGDYYVHNMSVEDLSNWLTTVNLDLDHNYVKFDYLVIKNSKIPNFHPDLSQRELAKEIKNSLDKITKN